MTISDDFRKRYPRKRSACCRDTSKQNGKDAVGQVEISKKTVRTKHYFSGET